MRPAVVIPPPAPGSAVVVPPPGAAVAPDGAVSLPSTVATPGGATVIPKPGQPALAVVPSAISETAGQLGVPPAAQAVAQPGIPSVLNAASLGSQPLVPPPGQSANPVVSASLPAAVPAIPPTTLPTMPSIVQNVVPPAASSRSAFSDRPLPIPGSEMQPVKKKTTTMTTTLTEESAGESSTAGAYSTPATSTGETFRPQAPILAGPGASVLEHPAASGSQPVVIVPSPGQSVQANGKVDPLADPDMLVRNDSRRPAFSNVSNVKPTTSKDPPMAETLPNLSSAPPSAPALPVSGKPIPGITVDRPAVAPSAVVMPSTIAEDARPISAANPTTNTVEEEGLGSMPSTSNPRPTVPINVVDGAEPESLQAIAAPVPYKSIFKRGPRAPAVLTIPAPLGKPPVVTVVSPTTTSDAPPTNAAPAAIAEVRPTPSTTPAVAPAVDATRPLLPRLDVAGNTRKPVPDAVGAAHPDVIPVVVDGAPPSQPGPVAAPSTRPVPAGVPALGVRPAALDPRAPVAVFSPKSGTAAALAKPNVASAPVATPAKPTVVPVIVPAGGRPVSAAAHPADAAPVPGTVAPDGKSTAMSSGAPSLGLSAPPTVNAAPPTAAAVAPLTGAPASAVLPSASTIPKPPSIGRSPPPPVAVIPIPGAVVAPVDSSRPGDVVVDAPQKSAGVTPNGFRPAVAINDPVRPPVAQTVDPSRPPAPILAPASLPVVLDAKGKTVAAAAPNQPAIAFSATATSSKPALLPTSATDDGTAGKLSITPGPSGSVPLSSATGDDLAPTKTVAAAAIPSADFNKLLRGMAEAKAEQQAILKAITIEAEKNKKEQAALFAALGAEIDKAKKEQQAQIKTLSADLDKSLRAAQKATTDEMKKTVGQSNSKYVQSHALTLRCFPLQAKEQVAFNVAGHLDDFSKAVSSTCPPFGLPYADATHRLAARRRGQDANDGGGRLARGQASPSAVRLAHNDSLHIRY